MNLNKTLLLIALVALLTSCGNTTTNKQALTGTWQSLWKEDMTLQLHFTDNNRFKTTLDRTGQVHTNYGWYSVEEGIFLLKDSIDLPLPVCNYSDTGKYQIRVSNDTLQFTVIADTCERRQMALQLAKFVKVK